MEAKAEYVALAVFASGGLLGGIGFWGVGATARAAPIAVFGTLSTCGIATMLLAIVVYSGGLVEEEPFVRSGGSRGPTSAVVRRSKIGRAVTPEYGRDRGDG